MRMTGAPYGVYDRDGALVYLGLHHDEDDCWRIFLGWPDQEDIDRAKASGLTVSPVTCVRNSELGARDPDGPHQ
jgi:hypothetical protein